MNSGRNPYAFDIAEHPPALTSCLIQGGSDKLEMIRGSLKASPLLFALTFFLIMSLTNSRLAYPHLNKGIDPLKSIKMIIDKLTKERYSEAVFKIRVG